MAMMIPDRSGTDRLSLYADYDSIQRASLAVESSRTLAVSDDVQPGVTVVILTLDKPELIIPLLDELMSAQGEFAEAGLRLQIIVGDTGSRDPSVLEYYGRLPRDRVEVVADLEYQFSRSNNDCVDGRVTCEQLLFLNNDVLLPSAGPLLMMYRRFATPATGVVGLALDFPGGTVQHRGVDFFRKGELFGLPYHPLAGERALHDPDTDWRAVAATGAALMVRTDLFVRAGGFDEHYEAECQDIDLCLTVRRLGFDVRVVDAGPVTHLENATRLTGEEHWQDRRTFVRRWGSFMAGMWS